MALIFSKFAEKVSARTYAEFKFCQLLLAISAFMHFVCLSTSSVHANSVCCMQYSDNNCSQNSCGTVYVAGDLLYWQPYLSSIDVDFGVGSLVQTTTNGVQVITSNESYKDPNFDWNTGYRLSAGYLFGCSCWELGGAVTNFNGKGSRNWDESSGSQNHSHCKIKFSQYDASFAYRNASCGCFFFKPFLGVRYAQIRENVKANIVTPITISSSLAIETRIFDDHQHYKGFGPLLGLNGLWKLGCGLGLYGNAAASVLYGTYHLHYNDTDTITSPVSKQVISSHKKHLKGIDCNIELALGISWETYFTDLCRLLLTLGVEHHQYFNQNRLGADRGDFSLDGATVSASLTF